MAEELGIIKKVISSTEIMSRSKIIGNSSSSSCSSGGVAVRLISDWDKFLASAHERVLEQEKILRNCRSHELPPEPPPRTKKVNRRSASMTPVVAMTKNQPIVVTAAAAATTPVVAVCRSRSKFNTATATATSSGTTKENEPYHPSQYAKFYQSSSSASLQSPAVGVAPSSSYEYETKVIEKSEPLNHYSHYGGQDSTEQQQFEQHQQRHEVNNNGNFGGQPDYHDSWSPLQPLRSRYLESMQSQKSCFSRSSSNNSSSVGSPLTDSGAGSLNNYATKSSSRTSLEFKAPVSIEPTTTEQNVPRWQSFCSIDSSSHSNEFETDSLCDGSGGAGDSEPRPTTTAILKPLPLHSSQVQSATTDLFKQFADTPPKPILAEITPKTTISRFVQKPISALPVPVPANNAQNGKQKSDSYSPYAAKNPDPVPETHPPPHYAISRKPSTSCEEEYDQQFEMKTPVRQVVSSPRKEKPLRIYKGSYQEAASSLKKPPPPVFPPDLQPLLSPEPTLTKALTKFSSTDWEVIVECFTTIVRLARFHPQLLQPNLHIVITTGIKHLTNLRSQVSRAACLLFKELFSTKHIKIKDTDCEKIVEKLLDKSGDMNKFIQTAANEALEAMVAHFQPLKSLIALDMHGTKHRNALIRASTARITNVLVHKVGSDKCFTELGPKLLPMLIRFLQDGNQETRAHAKSALQAIATHRKFESQLHRHVQPDELRLASKLIAEIKKKAKEEQFY